MTGAFTAGITAAQESADGAVAPITMEDLQRQIDDLSAQLGTTPRLGSSRSTMKLFGRIHLDYWGFSNTDPAIGVFENDDPGIDPQGNIEFRRARIGVSGDIDDSMLYKIELDFGHPDELAFKDMYYGFKDVPIAQKVLIGNQKRPYGLDHLNSSRFNLFMERPYIVESLNQDARRLGVSAYGTDEDLDWNWRYGVFNMTDWAKSGGYVSDRLQPEVAGRLANTFWWENDGKQYAHWAVSGSVAFPDGDPAAGDASNEARFRTRPEGRSQSRWIDTSRIGGTDHYELVGLEGVWNDGPAQVTAEYMNTWLSRGDDGPDLHFDGGYVQAAYFLTGEFMPWDRKSGTLGRPKPHDNLGPSDGAWQIAARYSFADFSDQDVFGGRGESLTFGLNWYWNPNASLQFNYIRGEISERNEVVGGNTYTGGDYEIFGIRMRVDF